MIKKRETNKNKINQRDDDINNLVKEMVDRPFGEEKKQNKVPTSISIPENILLNIGEDVYKRKRNGEKGVSISSIIVSRLNDYDF